VGDEQGFDLAKQIVGVHGLHQHGVGALFLPVAAEQREGGKDGNGGIVVFLLSFADHVITGGFGLHPHIGNDHLVGVFREAALGLSSRGGSFHFESVDFEDRFQRKQNGKFVINQQDATFHRRLQGDYRYPADRAYCGSLPIQSSSDASYRDKGCEVEQAPRFRSYDNTVAGYYIVNFGCRAQQADGSAIERQLADRGLARVASAKEAEVVVLNTCTVTAAADQDARAAIRRIRREQPAAKILVTGCYAQRAPEKIAALDGVTWVVGNSHKHQIGKIVSREYSPNFLPLRDFDVGSTDSSFRGTIYASDIFAHTQLQAAPVFDGIERTRPTLKIQDGCDNRCSFCVIPFVRGQSRSLPTEVILREVEVLENAGYRELVISGINLGRWGRDFEKPERFPDLLRAILGRSSIEKLRLSSVEPMDWTDDLIALMASSFRIAKHAHVPLQSGSDAVLRKMHRKYRPWHYAEKIENIRKAMPDAAIGADVMVGFPAETEELFGESLDFVESLPFTYLHVFTYSPRPGTPAASMPGQVPIQVAHARNRIMREAAASKNLAFRQSFVGRTLPAITLARSSDAGTEALTDNFLKVQLNRDVEPNRWIEAQVQSVTDYGLSAELVSR